MGKVRIEVLPLLAETLGMDGSSEEAVPDGKGKGCSLRELLNRLSASYRRFGPSVFDVQTQRLTGQVVVFVNGRQADFIEGLETRLNDGDTVTFVPFTEGG